MIRFRARRWFFEISTATTQLLGGRLSVNEAQHGTKKKQGRRLFYSLAFEVTTLRRLPAGTCSESYAYATRANAYSDARAWIVVAAVIAAIVVSTAFHIPRSVVFLNNYAGRTSFSPATSIIITNHSDSFDSVV